MSTLFVVDASGYLYRSYYAIQNITNARGESTNALFGFIRSILKLQKDFNPQHLAVIFDGPQSGKHREAIYEDYKAHRIATPPDLIYQITWAKQVCDLLGLSCLMQPDVEADDVMGALALWAEKQGHKVYLCTSDKDLCQLVNDHIHILNTFKENQILTSEKVEEVFGVTPHQMTDYLAITGDAADNVPGLPGFGPKTAAALLKEHGSLDYILAHPEVVSGKKQETIREFKEQARLSKRLVTIHTDIPIPEELSHWEVKPIKFEELKKFYASMNFNSLIRELEQQQPKADVAEKKEKEDLSYHLVNDEAALADLVEKLSQNPEVAISTLGSNASPMKAELLGIAFSTSAKEAFFVPTRGKLDFSKIQGALKPLFANTSIGFYGHNIKYDLHMLLNVGMPIATISFDTMLASYLLNSHSRQHSMEHLMLGQYGKTRKSQSDLIGKGKKAITLAETALEDLTEYCCEAADYTCRFKLVFQEQIKERKLHSLFFDLELPLLSVLACMEHRGIYVDVPYLHRMSTEIQQQIGLLSREIYNLAGEEFNLNSPKQLSHILFSKMGIRPPKKTATGLSTNAEVLESLSHEIPFARKILEYRVLEKLRSTYVDCLPLEVNPKTHRIHCTYNQSVAATGRLSCQEPNLQNIPIRSEIGRKIREAFLPEENDSIYLAADYSQIELRVLAHMSEDPYLIQAFQNDEDIHASTAAAIFNVPITEITSELRFRAKAVNFGIIYGQQAFGLSQQLGISIKEAAAFIELYFKRFKRVQEYVEECKALARKTGRATTYTGRERLIPEIHSKNGMLRSAAERLAINTPFQGTAADFIKMAMLQVDKQLQRLKLDKALILQIHDELIFEIPETIISEAEKMVRETMQGIVSLKVPLVVNITIGKNWAEC